MNIDQSTQATAAGATTENVLSGRVYQFAPYTGWCRLSCTAEAAGESRVTVYAGTRVVMPEAGVSRAARVPLLPDDILVTFPVIRGEQIIVKHRNTGAGSNTMFWRQDLRPRQVLIGPIGSRLGPRGGGAGSALAYIFDRAVTASAGSTNVVAEWQNLTGYELLLTNAVAVTQPGAGQLAQRAIVQLSPSSGVVSGLTARWLQRNDTAGAVAALTSASWQGNVIVPQGWYVQAYGAFDAAGAANTMYISLLAYARAPELMLA